MKRERLASADLGAAGIRELPARAEGCANARAGSGEGR